MSYVSLADAKKHLEVIHGSDDALIQSCIEAAEDYAANYMNRAGITDDQVWKGNPEEPASSDEVVPESVKIAILFLTTDYFEQRGQTVVGSINSQLPAAENMLHFYRIGLGV